MSQPGEIAVVVKVLVDEGGTPGSSLHSWRCEHPDRYGPCNCLEQTAEEIVKALEPLARQSAAAVARKALHDAALVGCNYATRFRILERALSEISKGETPP